MPINESISQVNKLTCARNPATDNLRPSSTNHRLLPVLRSKLISEIIS